MLTHLQPYLGSPPGTSHYDSLWLCHLPRALQIPRLPQHRPIALRSARGLPLPDLLHSERQESCGHLPKPQHCPPPPPYCNNVLPRLTVWLCLSCPPRLYNLHPGQVLQAAARHVPPDHPLSTELPAIQVPCGSCGDIWRGSFHASRWLSEGSFEALESGHKPRQECSVGDLVVDYKPAL